MDKPVMRKVDGEWQYVTDNKKTANEKPPIVIERKIVYTKETQQELWRVFLENARERGGHYSIGSVHMPTGERSSVRFYGWLVLVVILTLLAYQLFRG